MPRCRHERGKGQGAAAAAAAVARPALENHPNGRACEQARPCTLYRRRPDQQSLPGLTASSHHRPQQRCEQHDAATSMTRTRLSPSPFPAENASTALVSSHRGARHRSSSRARLSKLSSVSSSIATSSAERPATTTLQAWMHTHHQQGHQRCERCTEPASGVGRAENERE